ncbi:P-loop ATPase, Sll1717 family [Jiella mangrovi]|uniref:P-loop ATPase, Sll1717 family n=1 Tax=Jiella mangrovi TaxID=2821407 RepID=UPI001AE7D14A|nr:hypothetical protein [Jiella mangrovi]
MPTILPTFGEIRIGEPDANAEHFNALRAKENPVFLDAFFSLPSFPFQDFEKGQKFLVYGQKGTGKTTVMRYLENSLKENFTTHFLLFKRTFIEESDLQDISNVPLMLDERSIEKFRHYMHSIKRILLFILIKQSYIDTESTDSEIPPLEKSWIEKLRSSSIGDAIGIGFDSLRSIWSSAGVDTKKITNDALVLNAGRAVKRSNDDLLKFFIKRARRVGLKSCIFVDEIHFAYRSKEALQQDAMLVRDCILAIQTLNDRFSEEAVDVRIYSAVRSEYLEHPIIASADINHSVESIGHGLVWSTYPHNREHPLFQLLFKRFQLSMGSDVKFRDFFGTYFKNMPAEMFLSRTWAKPRDFIRFFKCAKDLYPQKSQLSQSEQNALWRRYSEVSWNELKSAASAFLNPPAIETLETIFKKNIPLIIDKHVKYNQPEFRAVLRPVYNSSKGDHTNFYSEDHFMELMYILGVFGTRRASAHGGDVIQTYHRGNRTFHRDGIVHVHPSILKAFG